MNSQNNRVKFLIIRFSSIGDIVLTTPVIRNLKTQVENAEVHYLTKKAFAPVLVENPYIDKLHSLNNDFGLLMNKLKAEKFDYIIDLHRNLRTFRVCRTLDRMAFAFEKLNAKKWLLVNLKINRMPPVHIVDRYLKTIELFVDKPDNKGLDYYIPGKDNFSPKIKEPFVAIVIGANHYTKQLPNKQIIELCNKLKKAIVLLGGKDDISKAAEIETGVNSGITNLVGKLNINQSASVIRYADWVITPDTGLMHIAAAFKRKIISIWGNTVPEFGMSAYKPDEDSIIFEQKGLKCRPCSKIGFKKCPKKHFNCMNMHNMDNIAVIANK